MDLYNFLYFLPLVSTCLASVITPRMPLPTLPTLPRIQARQTTSFTSTCGFLNGNANIPRVAPSGSDCRYDTDESVWGFYGTATTELLDCNIAVRCKDRGTCSSGCGESNVAGYFTQEWCLRKFPILLECYSGGLGRPVVFILDVRSGTTTQFFELVATTTAAGPLSTWSPPSAAAAPSAVSNTSPSPASASDSESAPASASNSPSNSVTKSSTSGSNSKTVASSVPRSTSAPSSLPEKSTDSALGVSNSLTSGESVFTVSGSLVTSFFGQTNTVGVTVLVTTTASGTPSPSPSYSTAPAPKNPPKYNPKALIGIVLGVLVFLLLLIFTLIWIGKYRRAQKNKSTTPTAESPTNFFFSNLPEVMEPFAKTDGIHELYDDHGELQELDVAGAVAGRTGRVSVRELAATPVVGGRRSGRRSAREMEGDMVWSRERISIKELDGGIFVRNGRRGDSMTQVFELDGQSYI
ncbi:uncharacterized protein EAE97_008709 [Botrytis byssoidea]|uniref:Mid2 domain-containing protein n=1 Tax=Botrytis byssoidea TaxID=139641 RepID=A0A9P5LP06_9HELO|nr:uncharacterized protein EAE97_008709 [Botrytis byssoidea]KAF7932942.1 hypothetical protein EAE97_008709 [Botrytis byssoidea]